MEHFDAQLVIMTIITIKLDSASPNRKGERVSWLCTSSLQKYLEVRPYFFLPGTYMNP